MVLAQQTLDVPFVAPQVAERRAVLQPEGQWVERVVKAQQVDRTGDVPSRPQSGERIGRRSEANIPQNELARVALEALDQAQLPDVQRLRFGDGADDRMKGLVMGHRMDAVRAIRQFDDAVSGGWLHGLHFTRASIAPRPFPHLS